MLDRQKLYKLAQTPFSWLSVAEELEAAAESVFGTAIGLEPAYQAAVDMASRELDRGATSAEIRAETPRYLAGFMLYGYAIENLLKGLIAVHEPERANENQSTAFKGHVSPGLAKSARFSPNEEQADILARLQRIVEWRGRYPVALKLRDQGGLAFNRDAIIDPTVDVDAVRRLYDVLYAALEAHVGKSRSKYSLLIRTKD